MVVNGACGQAVTNSVELTVNTVVGASPLSDLVKCPGEAAMFSTTASGTGPLSYVWQKDGSALTGQTDSTLTLPA